MTSKVDWRTYDYQAFNVIIAITRWDQLIFLKVSLQCTEAFLGSRIPFLSTRTFQPETNNPFEIIVFSNGNVTNQQ